MNALRGCETVPARPEKEGEVVDRCPHLREVAAVRIYSELAYCLGLPRDRVMVPSSDELRRFCTSRDHVDCPIFRAKEGVSPVSEIVR